MASLAPGEPTKTAATGITQRKPAADLTDGRTDRRNLGPKSHAATLDETSSTGLFFNQKTGYSDRRRIMTL